MADRRQKDVQWALDVAPNGAVSADDARLAVLMDIRDELKALNASTAAMRTNLRTISRKIPTRRKGQRRG